MTELLISKLMALQAYLFGPAFIFSPVYLPSSILIAYLVWRAQHRGIGFFQFLAPNQLYRHPSTWVDVKITLFNLLTQAPLGLVFAALTPTVTYALLQVMNGSTQTSVETPWHLGLLAAAILFLTEDFVRFLNHYLHHKSRALWPFHAVHHSAEVLTPISFTRAHPVYYLVQRIMLGLVGGTVQALLMYALIGQIEYWMLYAATAAFHLYVFLGAHLRHSHIRLSYGRLLEHVLISPAQHQIHHSVDPEHYNKNFGEIFALWDWLFGTLYIPSGNEELRFGVGDHQGRPIPQPYPTLRAAMLKPFGESWAALWPSASVSDETDPSLTAIPEEQ